MNIFTGKLSVIDINDGQFMVFLCNFYHHQIVMCGYNDLWLFSVNLISIWTSLPSSDISIQYMYTVKNKVCIPH